LFNADTLLAAKHRGAVGVVLALWCASVALGSADAGMVDVRGTVRALSRPEPDAVIWLDAPNDPGTPLEKPLVLDQRNAAFFPRVLAVRAGAIVDLPNNDRVFHNVFSFHDGMRFDLGLYPVGTSRQVRFDRPGLSRIFCNIHPNMMAYVKVVDSPYFAVSDREGRFTISSVPQGTYTYHAWRPGRHDLTGSSLLAPGKTLDLTWR
jgi:plastocyanin